MGEYNSKNTRVKPIFDAIALRNNWFHELLKFGLDKYNKEIPHHGEIIKKYWGDKEKTIPSPKEYLNWLICNVDKLKDNAPHYNTDNNETQKLRKKLFEHDIDTFRKAKYYEEIDNFKKSLSHRSQCEIEIIKNSYIGYLTWNEIITFFNIDKNKIPDTK